MTLRIAPEHRDDRPIVGFAAPARGCGRCAHLEADLNGVRADRDSLKRQVESLNRQNVELHRKLERLGEPQ